MQTVKLPQLAWYGGGTLELPIPDGWNTKVHNMAGHNRRPLTLSEIREAVEHPIGCRPIRDLAKSSKQVVIIFDDMSRATRTAEIVPFVLDELAKAGIADKDIRFVGAGGSHIAMDRLDFVKKLGKEVVRRFPIYSHNPFDHCVKVGVTTFGTEILVNAEVMKCELKIAVGSIVPHGAAGFGGGTKIVLPGICALQTIAAFHKFEVENRLKDPGKARDRSCNNDNPPRLNMDEAAKLVGLDVKIDALLNSYGETVAIYGGKPEEAFRVAVKDAREHYLTSLSTDNDIVISNTYAKANEFEGGVSIAFPSLKKDGGDIVLIGNAPDGHIPHYLFGTWGSSPHSRQTQINIPANVDHLIIFSRYPDLTVCGYFKQVDRVSLMSDWAEVLALLGKSSPRNARVAVYPNADIQYFRY